MVEHTLYGKMRLCYTEVTDFTDFQGIGQDPLYKRYDSVSSVIGKYIPEEYRDFLAQPVYSNIDDRILWYGKKSNESPELFDDLSQTEKDRYNTIKGKTLKVYNDTIATLKGEDYSILKSALTHIDDRFLFCYDGKVTAVSWGMMPDSSRHLVIGAIIHRDDYHKKCEIRFDEGDNGVFKTQIDGKMTRVEGSVLTERDIPVLRAKEGYVFKGWMPDPVGCKVIGNMVFTARYEKKEPIPPVPAEPEKVTVRFRTDGRGFVYGNDTIVLDKGSYLTADHIPDVSPLDGYIFTGWDRSTDVAVDSDTTFTAQYKKVGPINGGGGTGGNGGGGAGKPWYEKVWTFFTGSGCLKWFLWLLLAILIIFLLSRLFRSCESDGLVEAKGGIGDYTEIVGGVRDDNGVAHNIIGDDGRLPDSGVVAPIAGEDGAMPPVIQNPGTPDVVANRLNVYFEDENVDFNRFATDFKQKYPGDEYEIIGFDPEVGMIQLRIPESERDSIRENLNTQLPDYNFFIVDESIFTLRGDNRSYDEDDVGWHLRAINLKEGWKITKGDGRVIVAVVDDGCDIDHIILKGRVINPYNVYTQSGEISKGRGHGTHVAGLAVGSDKYYDKGVSGVAPKCKLMPVQVFDNGMCTFSSVTSGIMYAIHHGADVVNVSIGPDFNGLNVLPEEQQRQIAQTQFKNEEKVWRKIINVANKNNVILVLAVGNDEILAAIPPECRTDNTLNVSAVNKEYKVADFSNYGSGSNISAPGQAIASSFTDDQFAVFDGTSMAAPIVSGTAALMKSLNKNIGVNEVLHILQQSGRRVSGDVSPMVQVDKALSMQREGGVATINDDSLDGGYVPDIDAKATDYDAIRKLIEEYKQKIKELERLLPENNNR